MHRAPAVNFPVKRSRWHLRFLICMAVLAMVTLSAFVPWQGAFDERLILLTTVILLTSSVAFWGWRQSPQGMLRWDGQHWSWSNFAEHPVCRLQLLMDLQRVVLVSIAAENHAAVHLWLEAAPGNTAWKPLRRAIVSSQLGADGTSKTMPKPAESDVA